MTLLVVAPFPWGIELLYVPFLVLGVLLVAHVLAVPLALTVLVLLLAVVALLFAAVGLHPVVPSVLTRFHRNFEIVLALLTSHLFLGEVLRLLVPVELFCCVTSSLLYASLPY